MTLSSVSEVIYAGGDVPKNHFSKEKSEDYPIPIYSNGIEDDGLYGYTSEDYIRGEAGCITISARGTVGFSKLRKEPFLPVIRLLVVKPKVEYILPKYLEVAIAWIGIGAFGKTTPQLTVPQASNLEIPFPPLDIQRKIVVEIEQVENKEQEFRTAMTGIQTEIFTILEQCQKSAVDFVKLREVVMYSTEKIDAQSLDKDTYVGVDNLLPDVAGKRMSEFVPVSGKVTAYHPENILLSNIRPYLKKAWFADNHGGASGDVLVLVVNKKMAVPGYVFGFVSADPFFDYEMQNIGSKVKMPRADKKKVLDFPIPMLPIQEQQRIADEITSKKSEISKLRIQLSAMKTERDLVLKKYL
ncbi:MAG: hypothetical protein HFI64_10535 [Lachnospiraceae bacterium]|nr:hypothetical protein [Lachnospiraceae bacterium]